MKMQKALRHHEYGKPSEVLRLEEVPVPDPGPGEVRVKLLMAAINPSDYGMIGGSYGRLRELPAIAGREGVGEVEALGAGVAGVALGDRVRFPGEAGAWCAYACAPAADLIPVPGDVPVEQAAMSFINPPTAWCLLKTMAPLEDGDWIVQNAANSAVGISVIRMAKAFGLRTLNQVRREELAGPLKALGADAVVVEGSGWLKEAGKLTDDRPVRLALNSVGGASAIDQIKALGEGGTQVTFGGMVSDPVRFPTRFLIFNDVHLRGFWWDQWSRREGRERVLGVMAEVHALQASGDLEIPVAGTYPFEDYVQALAANDAPRLGKVLLRP